MLGVTKCTAYDYGRLHRKGADRQSSAMEEALRIALRCLQDWYIKARNANY